MVPVLLAGAVGAVVGALRRPLGAHLETPSLVLSWVAIAGVALQAAVGLADLPAEPTLFAASLAMLAGFAVVNRHVFGMGVLALGLVCNLVAVLVHGGMPVRATALVSAGVAEPDELVDVDLGPVRRFERTDDLLPIIGDVLPVRPLGVVLSFGDVIALVGVGTIANDLARYSRRGGRWSVRDLLPAKRLGEVGVGVEQPGSVDV